MTFFTACLAIHEQRIDQNRHCCTCTEIQPKKEATNRSCCYLCCCTGDGSKAADNVASILEKLSRMLVSCFVLRSFFKMLVLPIFVIFVAFSIWKTNSFTIGLYNPEHLTSSYYRKFVDTNDRVFKSDFYVTFVIPGFIHYGDFNFTNDVSFLKESLAANENIDSSSFISWCEAYIRFLNTSDPFKNDTFDDRITTFLSSHTQFKHDFAFDRDGTIISTRVYVKTRNVRTMTDILLLKQSLLIEKYISDRTAVLEKNNYITQVKSKMSKTDKLQNMTKRLTLTLYAPMFIFVDKYTRPLIESLIQIGVLIATNIILTTIVCPHVRVIVIQLFSFATTLVGLSGMMSVFGVEMTSFSMIIVVLGMCYVGDVNTHMLYSFYTTFRIDRQSRAHAVLTTTSITYFNTIIASLLGLLVLLLAKSYIFVTVMKILMITLILCFVQSILIYPIVLSLFGPNICHDGLIVKRISVPKIYRDLNGLKASDLKANNAYDNPNFNKGIAESNICGDLDDVKDRNLQANGALDQFKF